MHAIFVCRAYCTIRNNYKKMLEENPSVKLILNPKKTEMANNVGMYLKLIEDERKSLTWGYEVVYALDFAREYVSQW